MPLPSSLLSLLASDPESKRLALHVGANHRIIYDWD